jgi:uncharacterized protein (TIGR03083 family)
VEETELRRLIDERSAAFRAAVAAAPSLDITVPTCPGWTLFDLVRHLGTGRRKWAAIIAAGPAEAPPDSSTWEDVPAPASAAALLAWYSASIQRFLDAWREAGPDRGCWTWWGDSQSPSTSGGAARHQLQEIAVHTYDAQAAVGTPQPLPTEVALDGVEEFLSTCCSTTVAWPHEPAAVDYHVIDGDSWRLRLSADGAHVARPGSDPADAAVWGTASELVLLLYGRVLLDSLKLEGDRRHFERLIEWDPSE